MKVSVQRLITQMPCEPIRGLVPLITRLPFAVSLSERVVVPL